MRSVDVPDGVPVLSRGKHRSPRRGACFMEFASFLAGEQWSDHPSCTHPLLAQVARRVNDHMGHAGRQQLVPLIPSVVGRLGDDRTWMTLPVAVAAGPILDVPEVTQRILAAGLLSVELVAPRLARIWLRPGARPWNSPSTWSPARSRGPNGFPCLPGSPRGSSPSAALRR